MNVVAIDPEQRLAILAADDFVVAQSLSIMVWAGSCLENNAARGPKEGSRSKDNIEGHPDQC